MTTTQDFMQELKTRNPIQDVLADYGVVSKQADGKALCPFHDEDTPSFMIYEDTGSYHCYGCGAGVKGKTLKRKDGTEVIDAGSDVIAFVQNIEGVDFKEARKILARRAGLPVPEDRVDPALEKAKDAITDRNRRYYNALVKNPDAMKYFTDRGLDMDDIKKWRLGWVPQNEPGNNRGRLVFSIMEEHYQPDKAKSIALAYRKFDANDNGPKYRNDPNSNVYNKSTVLYGMNYALPNIRKKRYAIIMEGYMDVIKAHKVGLDNAVATCGTSFTAEQIARLRRCTDQLFFWYDGDAAGQDAALRALPDLLAAGFTVMMVESPGMDPDEVIEKVGKAGIVEYVQRHAKPAVQLVIEREVARMDALIKEEQSRLDAMINRERVRTLGRILPVIDTIQRPAEKFNYEGYVRKALGLG